MNDQIDVYEVLRDAQRLLYRLHNVAELHELSNPDFGDLSGVLQDIGAILGEHDESTQETENRRALSWLQTNN